MKENQKKTIIDKSEEQILKKQARQFLLDEIYNRTEAESKARSKNKAKNKAKVKESVKILLNSGDEINVDEYVSENYAEPATHFFKPFYNLIADLLKISRSTMIPFVKPPIVAMLKRRLIYGRFPNAVQARIYKRNPYTGFCSRKYWNYQTLTKKGDEQCRGFIDDFQKTAESILINGGSLKEFIVSYCTKYNIPIQLDLFENE